MKSQRDMDTQTKTIEQYFNAQHLCCNVQCAARPIESKTELKIWIYMRISFSKWMFVCLLALGSRVPGSRTRHPYIEQYIRFIRLSLLKKCSKEGGLEKLNAWKVLILKREILSKSGTSDMQSVRKTTAFQSVVRTRHEKEANKIWGWRESTKHDRAGGNRFLVLFPRSRFAHKLHLTLPSLHVLCLLR